MFVSWDVQKMELDCIHRKVQYCLTKLCCGIPVLIVHMEEKGIVPVCLLYKETGAVVYEENTELLYEILFWNNHK